MTVTRRTFLKNGAVAGTMLTVDGPLRITTPWPTNDEDRLAPYLTGRRIAFTPATHYRAYRSKPVKNPLEETWVQIDLKNRLPIESILLFPASERIHPGRDEFYAGEGFPLRFRIEISDDPEFSRARLIADFTRSDFPDPKDNITQFHTRGVHARYVRLTATQLRLFKTGQDTPFGVEPPDSTDYTLTLAKIGVVSGGKDVAVGCTVSADANNGNTDLLSQLTRPPRQDGEDVRYDKPQAVTDPKTWKPVKYKVKAPTTGVALDDGLFRSAMKNNIGYLLSSYSTDDVLRQFYERVGKIKYKGVGSDQILWEEDLAGSNAGRFLMGAGTTLRWIEDAELRRRMDAVVDGIEDCRQRNGYIMAYPEDTIFYSERAAYSRAWVTHGLLEAAYCGNPKALPMLRGYYDWFNQQDFLPYMLRGVPVGNQGMIANTRICLSPVGRAADAQLIQRYFQEDAWLAGLARREPDQVWQYPYDRPHCYLLTTLESYLDMYLITGEQRYYDAVQGGCDLYRDHWQQAGGSISIIEMQADPPDSNYLRNNLGELCGSCFWIFLNQRFQLLDPNSESYTMQIEKAIYNVVLADQVGEYGLRYHTNLEGKKERGYRINTCCEGQGTRVIGSLPEYIYSIAPDGLYVNLFESSAIRWEHQGHDIGFVMKTKFPLETKVRCTVETSLPARAAIRIRVPGWATGEMKISVNSEVFGSGMPGTFFTVDRQWRNGDTIDFDLPIAFRIKPYNGADQVSGAKRFSIEYGPILLAAVGAPRISLMIDQGHEPEELASYLEPVPGEPLRFTVRGNAGQKLMPYWEIFGEEFTCYPIVASRA